MDLSDLVGTLRAPGTPDELSRAESTVAAMTAAHAEAAAGVVALAPVDRRRAALAAGATVGIVAVVLCAGTAAAAFSGALPAGLQNAAHNLLGAPSYVEPPAAISETAGDATSGDAAGPVGPGVSTDAASLAGLCTAFAGVASDDPQADSVAYRALASAAAAAAESIEDYCGAVIEAGGKPSVTPPSQKPTAKPTPTKKPTSVPSTKPTAVPAKPTATPPTPTRKPAVSTAADKPSGAGAR